MSTNSWVMKLETHFVIFWETGGIDISTHRNRLAYYFDYYMCRG